MAMRYECKNFESRTYVTGEVVRKCRLDLAPNAPWECPKDCQAYERRTVNVGWDYGSLAEPIVDSPEEVENVDAQDAAKILDEAEDIVSAIAPELLSEFQALDAAENKKKGKSRFTGKKKKKK